MELDSVAKVRRAFLRLVGAVGSDGLDDGLASGGEEENEVVDLYLTRGFRRAQRYLLAHGYGGWRKVSGVLAWTGPGVDGRRYVALPQDFLRAAGNQKRSALVGADGQPWGQEIHADNRDWPGSHYFIEGEKLWLTRNANPPSPLHLEYHYRHPAFEDEGDGEDGFEIDFPLEVRALGVAESANLAKEESWLPGGQEMELKIERATVRARDEARDFARPTKQPRQMRRPARYGNHWLWLLAAMPSLLVVQSQVIA